MENTQIEIIINEVMLSLKERNGLKDITIKHLYWPGFSFVIGYYRKGDCSKSVDMHFLLECYNHMLDLFASSKLSKPTFSRYRKSISVMEQYLKSGRTYIERLSPVSLRFPIKENETVLKHYLEHERPRLVESSLNRNGNIIRQFLLYLEDNSCAKLNQISEGNIVAFLQYMSDRRPAGLSTVVPAIRGFTSYLYDAGITMRNFSSAATVKVIRRHKIYGTFSNQETSKILNQIDVSTSAGKRDRAILLLASHNGLRSSDILNLKLGDIRWKEAELFLIQKKTSLPVSCPIDTEVGNALVDYILRARPASKLPNVFLGMHPSQTLSSSALCLILKKYMLAAGVVKSPKDRAGIHTFRRTLGTSLLENDIPLETIAQVLGHSSTQSTKQYLSISEQKLAECAIPVDCPSYIWEDSND